MSAYDPVPREYLLDLEIARRVIHDIYIGGEVTPRELSLQVLVDNSQDHQAEISMFQRAGRGDIEQFFGFMRRTLDLGAGRHVQHVIATACLYPERETIIDLPAAATAYMEAHGTKERDLLNIRVFMGSLSIEALIQAEENELKVQKGALYIPSR